MSRRIIPFRYVALAFLSVSVTVESQARTWIRSSEAEKSFAAGLESYRAGDFERALEKFQRLLEFPLNQRSSAGQLLQGKSLYRLGRFAEALDAARGLQRKFDDSRYLPDARLLTGDAFYKLKRYYEAATQYGRLLATPTPLYIQAQAAERMAAIANNGHVNEQGLENLRLVVGAGRLREALFFGTARWYRRLGWDAEADRAMQTYRDSVKGGIFARLAFANGTTAAAHVDLPDEIDFQEPEIKSEPIAVGQQDLPRIGLLLPLTGPYSQIGEELFEGVQLANEEAGGLFELIVADTGVDYGDLPIGEGLGGDFSENPGSGLLRVAHGAKQLLAEGIVAMIGPVFSSSSVVAAVVAESAGVPLIVPLSQQGGLDSLGRHIFQLKIIPETQAQILGEYATLVLGLEHLVLISPLSDYGWSFAREFTRVAEINGAEVVHSDWYIPNLTKDFRRVFEEIRGAGFTLMQPADTLAEDDALQWTTLDSLRANDEPSFLTELLQGLDGEAESAEDEVEEEEAPPDSSEIFVDTIDGVVVIVESFADAQTIAPQVHFHRLETQVLGNDLWYEPEAIRQMRPGERKDFEGVTFVSSRREGAVAAQSFVDSFRKRFRRDPNYAASGYDAAGLLVEGWGQGHRDRESLTQWLAAIGFYEGASGMISLTEDDSLNSELILLKIDRGKIRPLAEVDLPVMGAVEQDLPMSDLDLPEDNLPMGELD